MKEEINKVKMGSFTPYFSFETFLFEQGYVERQYSPLNAFYPFRDWQKSNDWISIGFGYKSKNEQCDFYFQTSNKRGQLFRLPFDNFTKALQGDLTPLQ